MYIIFKERVLVHTEQFAFKTKYFAHSHPSLLRGTTPSERLGLERIYIRGLID